MDRVIPESEAGTAGLSDADMRRNVITLAFDGNEDKFKEFCDLIQVAVPPGTSAVLRGSSVTGERYDDGAPFDADGPRTSDLDLTLIGGDVVDMYNVLTGTYLPGLHTKPMGDDHPDIAPSLEPLREKLCSLVCRPVNIQASRDIWQQLRGDLMGQPYLTLFGEVGG